MNINSRHHVSITTARDECWSESSTETLIDSWGHRYLHLNRGNLRQKDWTHIAQTVNANRDPLKPPRTDAQCKNRIDTLKKKYKLEKSKLIPSKWPFFHRLDHLIGTSVNVKKITNPRSALTAAVSVKPNPNVHLLVNKQSETAYEVLANAIVRIGEVYERVESLKQEEAMKLEKQRMEFTREVEFQRLNMFMEAQLQLQKMKMKMKTTSSAALSPGKKSEV